MAHLIIEQGAKRGENLTLPESGELLVGRSSKADVTIEEKVVSRKHFLVKKKNSTYYLKDLDSGNGTFVNGRAVTQCKLEDGDRIQAGETEFTFVSEEARKERKKLVGETIGGYKILELLGRGGMGTVYKARQLSLDRTVAFKLLSEDLMEDKKFVDRFLQEARSAAKLNHPNVIQVFDVERTEGHFYISMEYVTGGSVQDLLSEEGKIEPGRALSMIKDAARALEFAQEKNLIHRDIKPDNLMITKENTVKIIDLGIAQQATKREEEKGRTVVGTPDYMAPEQAMNEPVDARADLYSLGCTFYRMVTGERPFQGDSLKEIIKQKLNDPPSPPAEKNADVPEWVSDLIMNLLEPDPEDRISSATTLLERIDQGLSSSQDKEPGPHVRNFIKRRWPSLLAGSTVGAVLLSMGIFLLIPSGNGKNEEKKKTKGRKTAAAKRKEAEKTRNTANPKNEKKDSPRAGSPKYLFTQAKQQFREAVQSNSLSAYQNAIEQHVTFLKSFPGSDHTDTVSRNLEKLKQKKRAAQVLRKINEVRRSFQRVQKWFQQKTIVEPSEVSSLQNQVQQQARSLFQNILPLQTQFIPEIQPQIQQLQELIKTWRISTLAGLDHFRNELTSIHNLLKKNNFQRLSQRTQEILNDPLYHRAPYRISLQKLNDRIQKKESDYFDKHVKPLEKAIQNKNFEKATSIANSVLARLHSQEFRNQIKQKKKQIVKKKKQLEKTRRRKEIQQERQQVFQQASEYLIALENDSLPTNQSYFQNISVKHDRNKRLLNIFRFIEQKRLKLPNVVDDHFSRFKGQKIKHPSYGEVTLLEQKDGNVKVRISSTASSMVSWSTFAPPVLMNLLYHNREFITSEAKQTLGVLYFLYGHRKRQYFQRSEQMIKNLKNSKELLKKSLRPYFLRQKKEFQNQIAKTLFKIAQGNLEHGTSEKIEPALRLIRNRFNKTTFYKNKKEAIWKLASNLGMNWETVSWKDATEPYRENFENEILPTIQTVIEALKKRENRLHLIGKINLYLGKSQNAYRVLIRSIPDPTLARIKQGKEPTLREKKRDNVERYENLFRASVLSGNETYQGPLINWIRKLTGNTNLAKELVRWRDEDLAKLKKKKEEYIYEFNKSFKKHNSAQKIASVFQKHKIPNLKKRYIASRYLAENTPNHSYLLDCADALYWLGAYISAKTFYEKYFSKKPDKRKVRALKKRGGKYQKTNYFINLYGLR